VQSKPLSKPSPVSVPKAPVSKASNRPALPESPADEAVVAVERSLRRGELTVARKQLDLAISYYGDRPAYARLQARLVRAESSSGSATEGMAQALDGETEPVDTFDADPTDAPRKKSPLSWIIGGVLLLALVVLLLVFIVF